MDRRMNKPKTKKGGVCCEGGTGFGRNQTKIGSNRGEAGTQVDFLENPEIHDHPYLVYFFLVFCDWSCSIYFNLVGASG